MGLLDVIDSFSTDDGDGNPGEYLVTRPNAKSLVNGKWVSGGSTTFTIVAVRTPATGTQRFVGGRNQIGTEQGQFVDDIQQFITATQLNTRDSLGVVEPDLITALGGQYEVVRLERWEIDGEPHWRAIATRLNQGAA